MALGTWLAGMTLAFGLGGRLLAAETPAAAPAEATPGTAPGTDAVEQQIQKVLEKARSAVVRVEGTDEHGWRLAGSGFFVDPNGLLFTSYSVGGETRDLVVVQGDLKYSARRLVADERSGLAILKVDAETAFVPLGSTRELHPGSMVMTVGYPMDLPLTPSFGVIGGFDRKYLGLYFATTHLRANVPVQRGECGAPLLNMKGEVMGVLISSMDSGSACFVLPVEAAEKVRRDFVRFREVRPGWIGISLKAAEAPVEGSNALITDVFPGAPGEKAGLLSGDVVLQVGDRHITTPEDMLDASFFLSAEEQVNVKVVREGAEMNFDVETTDVPGRHPAETVGPIEGSPRTRPGEGLEIGAQK
jgi:serine protease Do